MFKMVGGEERTPTAICQGGKQIIIYRLVGWAVMPNVGGYLMVWCWALLPNIQTTGCIDFYKMAVQVQIRCDCMFLEGTHLIVVEVS